MPNTTSHTWASLIAALYHATEEDPVTSTLYTAELPELVRRAETRLYTDLNLEIFDRVRTGALTAGQYLQAIKTSTWQGTKSFHIRNVGGAGPRRYLRKRTYEYCLQYQPDETATAEPRYYAEYSDTQFFVSPPPNVAYAFELREISRDATLTLNSVQTTTWLSQNAGSLLFRAAMVESEIFLQGEAADITSHEALYQAELAVTRLTLRDLIRNDTSPIMNAPRTVQDKP